MLERFSLQGRVAIVTGGSSGIGRGVALGMAEAGADIAIASRTAEKVEAVCEEIEGLGRKALPVPTDVTDPDQVARLIERTRGELGRLDILVNNAGGSVGANFHRGPLLKLTPADFDGCIAVNTRSVFLCSVAAVPVMQEQGSGVIINMASIGGTGSNPPGVGFALYGAAKAAVINLTRSMAVEWAPQIRVNAIAPGQIDTPRVTGGAWSPEQRANQIRRVAMGRNGLPEDIAGAAVYLASDAAAWTTGICLEVHGGLQNPDRRLT